MEIIERSLHKVVQVETLVSEVRAIAVQVVDDFGCDPVIIE